MDNARNLVVPTTSGFLIKIAYDLHATALHLLGIHHTRLTFYHNGIERRLTDVHGHVIEEILHETGN